MIVISVRNMPELPEVQTVVNQLRDAGCIGAAITGVRVVWARSIDRPEAPVFCDELFGCRVKDIRRRGKFIVFYLSASKHLLIHLRMSGRLYLADPGAPPVKHEHVFVDFEHGRQLRFHDTRKFGRFYLVDNPDAILAPAVTLGVTRGRDYHLEGATMEIEPMFNGIAQILGVIRAIDSGVCDGV